MTRRLVTLLAALLVLVAAPACGGSDDDEPTAGDAATATTGGDADETKDEEGEGASSGDAVTISDFSFKPSKLTVTAGTKVTFTNDDGFAHTVTAKDKAYESGSIDGGGTFEHTYDAAGTFDYQCSIHNSMTGTVVVE